MVPYTLTRCIPILAVLLAGPASAASGASARDGSATPMIEPQAHSQTSEHYVNGRYDKTGTYIPPHYQTVSKPRFHGYFFNKNEGGDKAQKPQ